MPAEGLLLYLIIGGRLEQRVSGFAAIDIRQAVNIFARARIAVTGHHYGLEDRRIPALVDDLDRSFVANRAGGNRRRDSRTFSSHAFDCLSAERLSHRVFLIFFQSEIESHKSASAAAANGDRCARSRRLASRLCRRRCAFKAKDAALVTLARIRIEREGHKSSIFRFERTPAPAKA